MKEYLPDFLIADLYKSSLINDIDTKRLHINQQKQDNYNIRNLEQSNAEKDKKWFLGDNKKNVSILIKEPESVYISDEHLITLNKLLNACRLAINDVSIINCFHNSLSFETLRNKLQPQYALLFGVSTEDISLPFTIPDYQTQSYAGCTFITASADLLSAGKQSKDIETGKRKLWEALKTIFNI